MNHFLSKVAKAPLKPLRSNHRALVLGQLRSHGPMARADLSRALGVSAPTIADILDGFEADGLVTAVGEGPSSGGRRPVLYAVRPAGLLAAGISVERESISAVVCDLGGAVHAQTFVQHELSRGSESFVTALRQVLDTVTADLSAGEALTGLGVALPVVVRRSNGGVFVPADKSDPTGVDIPAVLRDRWDLPVVVENRAHAIAMGEYLFGSGQEVPDQLCLVLGPGLGAAVISHGQLLAGGDGAAGALGRIILDPPGTSTQRRVTDLVNDRAIAAGAARRLRDGTKSCLSDLGSDLGAEDVIDAGLAGDRLAIEVLATAGRLLGTVVAAALCVTDSQLILACGPLMRAGTLLLDPLREEASARYPFPLPESRLGTLGTSAGTLGAAALVLRTRIADTEPRAGP